MAKLMIDDTAWWNKKEKEKHITWETTSRRPNQSTQKPESLTVSGENKEVTCEWWERAMVTVVWKDSNPEEVTSEGSLKACEKARPWKSPTTPQLPWDNGMSMLPLPNLKMNLNFPGVLLSPHEAITISKNWHILLSNCMSHCLHSMWTFFHKIPWEWNFQTVEMCCNETVHNFQESTVNFQFPQKRARAKGKALFHNVWESEEKTEMCIDWRSQLVVVEFFVHHSVPCCSNKILCITSSSVSESNNNIMHERDTTHREKRGISFHSFLLRVRYSDQRMMTCHDFVTAGATAIGIL